MPQSVSLFNLPQSDLVVFIVILIVAILALTVTRRLLHVSGSQLLLGFLGVVGGLWIGSLVANPLSNLPGNFGRFLPIIVSAFITVAVVDVFLGQTLRLRRFFALFERFVNRFLPSEEEPKQFQKPSVVVDTSVLIDGRIEEIAKSGFVFGKLLLPRFVLDELQTVADSEDDLKRARGRRGLEVLSNLQKNPDIEVEILEEHERGGKVDLKLIKVAKNHQAKILTIDYNLNRVASISGVEVLNINELANAVKPVLIPGENLMVKVIQKGKEKGQGVGFLPDGTMIVVEGGDDLIDREIECTVERIFQTVAGKMIFVKPKE